MPAHKKQIFYSKNELKLFNTVIKILINQGFYLLPNKDRENFEHDFEKYFKLVDNQIFAIGAVGSFGDVLRFASQLPNQLITLDKKFKLSWNYLGSQDIKKNYFEYITTVFWENQNNSNLLNHMKYPEMLENPWLLSRYIGEIGLETNLAFNFFDNGANNFIAKIEENFGKKWETNPYLIEHKDSTFNWQIDGILKRFTISGFVIKTDKGLQHNIQLTCK